MEEEVEYEEEKEDMRTNNIVNIGISLLSFHPFSYTHVYLHGFTYLQVTLAMNY